MPASIEELTVPSNEADIEDWLIGHEERIADIYRVSLELIVFQAAEAYTATLVASGDPAALDGYTVALTALADDTAGEITDMYQSGGLSAWLRRGADNVPPIDVQAAWAKVMDVNAIAFLETTTNRMRNSTLEVWGDVKGKVNQSLLTGMSNVDLQKEVKKITGYSASRAEAIARTETMGAYNGGLEEGAMAMPPEHRPVAKEWLATRDSRTRKTHKAANGQVVGMDEEFVVGGRSMSRPLASGAPADEVVNCRCTMLLYYPGDELPDGSIAQFPEGVTDPDSILSTKELYQDTSSGTAVWDADRVADVHDPYVEEILKGGIARPDPVMRFMGGGSGAGKGSLQATGKIVLRKGSVVVDSDDAKKFLPEYETMVDSKNEFAAAFAHEESSFLGKRAMKESLESNFDTMLDGTGNSSIEKITAKVNAARSQGAKRVVADYVTIDTDEAVRRATLRAEQTGRKVPLDTIRGTHESVSHVFPQAVKNDLFDEVRLWDNNGDSPRLIFQQIDGVTEILDPEAYASFLAKSPLDEGFRAAPAAPVKTVPARQGPSNWRPEIAEKYGVSSEEMYAQRKLTQQLKEDVWVEAAEAQREALGWLDQAQGTFMQHPRNATGGEYDWYKGLAKKEKDRLNRWFVDDPTFAIDKLAQNARSAGAISDAASADQFAAEWLRQTRIVDAAASIRQGRWPGANSSRFGGVDGSELLPRLAAQEFDASKILGVDIDDAVGYVAQTRKAQVGDEAFQILGNSTASELPPWRMSFQGWENEVRRLESKADGPLDQVGRDRLSELVPQYLDTGQDYEELYAEIVETARIANLPVSDSAVIPWL